MLWPQFDPVLAINQAVAGLYTLVGVVAGGYVAFWIGIRQLRKARAIDRRLEWNEKLHAELAGLQVALRDLAFAAKTPEPVKTYLTKSAKEQAHQRGRSLEQLLNGADLNAMQSERTAATQLRIKNILVRSQTLGRDLRPPIETASAEDLERIADELEPERLELVGRIRAEIGLKDAQHTPACRQFRRRPRAADTGPDDRTAGQGVGPAEPPRSQRGD